MNPVSRTVPGGPIRPHSRTTAHAVEQGPGHGDGVEPPPVMGRLASFQVERGHRPVLGVLLKYDFTDNRIYDD